MYSWLHFAKASIGRSKCRRQIFVAFCQGMLGQNNFLPANGFSIKPLKVKLLAGEQKATEFLGGETKKKDHKIHFVGFPSKRHPSGPVQFWVKGQEGAGAS